MRMAPMSEFAARLTDARLADMAAAVRHANKGGLRLLVDADLCWACEPPEHWLRGQIGAFHGRGWTPEAIRRKLLANYAAWLEEEADLLLGLA